MQLIWEYKRSVERSVFVENVASLGGKRLDEGGQLDKRGGLDEGGELKEGRGAGWRGGTHKLSTTQLPPHVTPR